MMLQHEYNNLNKTKTTVTLLRSTHRKIMQETAIGLALQPERFISSTAVAQPECYTWLGTHL